MITTNWLVHSFHQGRFVNFSYDEYMNKEQPVIIHLKGRQIKGVRTKSLKFQKGSGKAFWRAQCCLWILLLWKGWCPQERRAKANVRRWEQATERGEQIGERHWRQSKEQKCTESVGGSIPGGQGQCSLCKGPVFPAGDTQVSRTSAVLGGAAESCGDGGSNDERGNNEWSDLETEATEEKEDTQ